MHSLHPSGGTWSYILGLRQSREAVGHTLAEIVYWKQLMGPICAISHLTGLHLGFLQVLTPRRAYNWNWEVLDLFGEREREGAVGVRSLGGKVWVEFRECSRSLIVSFQPSMFCGAFPGEISSSGLNVKYNSPSVWLSSWDSSYDRTSSKEHLTFTPRNDLRINSEFERGLVAGHYCEHNTYDLFWLHCAVHTRDQLHKARAHDFALVPFLLGTMSICTTSIRLQWYVYPYRRSYRR